MPTFSNRSIATATFAASFIFVSAAWADVPGPNDEVCRTEGLGCSRCWKDYNAQPEQAAEYDSCAAALREQGLVEGCRNGKGGGEIVWFCPQGTNGGIVSRGGGCGGCTTSRDTSFDLAAIATAIGLGIALARRPGRARL